MTRWPPPPLLRRGWLRLGPWLVAALTVAGTALTYGALMDRQQLQLEAVADTRARQAGRWLQVQLQQAQRRATATVAGAPYRDWQASGEPATLQRLLEAAVQLRQALGQDQVLLLDDLGSLLASERPAPGLPPLTALTAREALATGRPSHTGLAATAAGGADIDLLLPLPADGERPRVVLVLRSDAGGFLQPLLTLPPLPGASSATTLLVRQLGEQLYGSAGEPPLSLADPRRLAARVIRGEVPLGQVTTGTDPQGRAVLGVVQPVDDAGWFLVARITRAEARLQAAIGSLWVVLAGLLAMLAIGVTGRLRRSQHALEDARRQQAAQAERLRGLALMQAIAEGSSDAIFAKDLQGRYVLCNREASRIIGQPVDAVLGRDDRALFAAEQAEAVMANDAQVMAEGRLRSYEERIDTALGAQVFLATKGPLRDEHGAVVGMFGISRDITHRRQAEEALRESAARYRSMVSVLDEGILVFDARLQLLACNAQAERFFGMTLAQLQAPGMLQRWQPLRADGRPLSFDELPLARTRRTGHPCRNMLVGAALPSGMRWLMMNAEPVRDGDDDRLTGVVTSFSDITERYVAEGELRKLSMAVAQSPLGIAISDLQGRIEYVNEAFSRISGWSAEQAIGRPHHLLQPDRAPAEHEEAMRRQLAAGQAWSGEFSNSRRNGEPYAEFVQAAPIRQPDGRITHHLLVVEDITEHQRIASELDSHRHRLQELVDERTRQLQDTNALLVASRDKAEAANRAKSAFLANMSHEIRTPLNAIVGLTHLLRRDAHGDIERERLARVSESADHLLQVLNDILDLSRIEAGRLTLACGDFSLAALLNSCCALVAERAGARGLSLTVDHAGVPDALCGDAARLSQALSNLLSNAVKFTERGGITLRVSAQPEGTAERPLLRFEVRDTGIGIAAEHVPGLFGAFVQADGSTTRRFGGTGLGLAITRRLAELMGGEVGVQSQLGQGSCFWFTARLQAGDPAAAARHWAAPRTQQFERLLQRHCAGARVLLVEDNPVNQDVMRELLQAAGLQVQLAADGAQALARLAAPNSAAPLPDLVLMDLHMPVMDGLEATRRLRAAQPAGARALPVLAMTASALGEDREACLAAGMNDHLAKPVQAGALYAMLWRWLRADATADDDGWPDGDAAPTALPTTPAGVAAEGAGAPSWLQVPGLDADQARQYLGGRADVQRRVLRQFALQYEGEAARLAAAVAQDDLATVRAVAHALRSAAGAIGATAVAADARSTEAAAQRADAHTAPAALAAGLALADRTAELVRDIRVALQADAAAHPPLADPGGGAPVPTVTLDRLEALLGASDYDAQTLFRSVAGGLRRSSPDQVDAMEAALARFDYDEVLALLRGLRSATPAGGG